MGKQDTTQPDALNIAFDGLAKKNEEILQLRAQLAASERKLQAVTAALEGLGVDDEDFGIRSYGRCVYCVVYFKGVRDEHSEDCPLIVAKAAIEAARGDE
jgi:hypothetical protein